MASGTRPASAVIWIWGVGRCILGTIAVRDFDFTARMARTYGDRIAVGVDMKDGFVAVAGWREVTPEPGIDFCRRLAGRRGQGHHCHRTSPGTVPCRAPTWISTGSCCRFPVWRSPPPAVLPP